ncbi:MAG: M28 family peptidase [Candidatus Hodarchaeota archaeon]
MVKIDSKIISTLILLNLFFFLTPIFNVNIIPFSSSSFTLLDNNFRFNSSRTYDLILKQVHLGPRYPGSEGIEKTRHLIASELLPKERWTVIYQNFSKTWINNENVTLVNVICKPNSYDQSQPSFLLLAHYDTRLRADEDPDPSKQKQPVIGANDGASGVAVALELGRTLLENYNVSNLQLVFFDGEDQGRLDGLNWDWLVGSEFYAKSQEFKKQHLSFGILFDMVGGINAIFRKEKYSVMYAEQIVSYIWDRAATLGYDDYFINQLGKAITDDHLSLLNEGFPAIDIIDDFSSRYIPWHTTFDNMTYISKETLEAVGYTIESVLSNNTDLIELYSNLQLFTFQTSLYCYYCLSSLILVPLIIKLRRRIFKY